MILLTVIFNPFQNPKTKLDEVVPFEKQSDELKRRLAKNNEAKMVIYNALPRKEYERILWCNAAKEFGKLYESIDSAFARFNTIITSLKSLDEGYSSKNYVRKFFRALHPKWRAKVTAIEESEYLTSLSLVSSIGNSQRKVKRILLFNGIEESSDRRSVRLPGVKTKNMPWR
ncbi:hypothetical protein Tco_1368129 [Tanacetum coccineum]